MTVKRNVLRDVVFHFFLSATKKVHKYVLNRSLIDTLFNFVQDEVENN